MVNNLIWVNPTGADLGSSANGSYNKPYSNIDYAYQSIANGINLNQNSDWFIFFWCWRLNSERLLLSII